MRTASTIPGARVTAASACGGDARSAATPSAVTTTTSRPCTCDSQTGSEGSTAPTRRRFSPIAPARSAADGAAGAEIERRRGAGARAAVARREERAHARRPLPRRHDPVETARFEPIGERVAHRGAGAVAAARSAAISAARSAGAGDSHCIGARVTGWTSPEAPRVQCLARERERGRGQRQARLAASAVRGVAEQRMPERGQVHADLVRAPGFEAALHERGGAEALDDVDVRARGLAGRDDGHLGALRRMAPDRRVDRRRAREVAEHDRDVLALDAARRQLPDEIDLRGPGLRDDHEPARVLVEPVHDARARQRGQRGRVMQQRVLQRAVAVAAARMHDEAGRLVEDEERVVLVHDRERDRLRGHAVVGRRRRFGDDDRLAAVQLVARRHDDRRADDDLAGLDPALEAIARMLRQQLRQRLVEPRAGQRRGHGEAVAGRDVGRWRRRHGSGVIICG